MESKKLFTSSLLVANIHVLSIAHSLQIDSVIYTSEAVVGSNVRSEFDGSDMVRNFWTTQQGY